MLEIVKPGTQIDFIGRWKLLASLSLALILLSVAMIPVRGFRLGVDFAGGNEVQVRFADRGVGEAQLLSVVEATMLWKTYGRPLSVIGMVAGSTLLAT